MKTRAVSFAGEGTAGTITVGDGSKTQDVLELVIDEDSSQAVARLSTEQVILVRNALSHWLSEAALRRTRSIQASCSDQPAN